MEEETQHQEEDMAEHGTSAAAQDVTEEVAEDALTELLSSEEEEEEEEEQYVMRPPKRKVGRRPTKQTDVEYEERETEETKPTATKRGRNAKQTKPKPTSKRQKKATHSLHEEEPPLEEEMASITPSESQSLPQKEETSQPLDTTETTPSSSFKLVIDYPFYIAVPFDDYWYIVKLKGLYFGIRTCGSIH